MSRRIMASWMLVLAAAGFGCGSEGEHFGGQLATISKAPEVGKADSQDIADRACQVILRRVAHEPAADWQDYETDCSSGACLYVWRGIIDVADGVEPEAQVLFLYHLSTDPGWWEMPAEPAGASEFPGYRRYTFAVHEHLFGPQTEGKDGLAIEAVAFVRRADGSRLFDHNARGGDFENALLNYENNWSAGDMGKCQPTVGDIHFLLDWTTYAIGARRQGSYLRVRYDLERLGECRGTHNGFPCWDIVAHARFLPGGQEVSGSVRQFVTNNGTPTNQAESAPFVTIIPEGADWVELWFENFSGCGSGCRAWDSNYGQNYRLDIWPAADHPRCINLEKDNPRIHSEDFRMPHNEPYCLPYELAAQYDANYCEFWPVDVGLGYVGHYGIPFRWLFANLKIGDVEGAVLNAGLFTRDHHNADGKEAFMYSLGTEQFPGQWRVGFAYLTYSQDVSLRRDYTIDEFAFFIDVRRPAGEVVRLWQSRSGQNYRPGDAFSLPTYTEYIPYGNIQWADQAASVFDSKRACTD